MKLLERLGNRIILDFQDSWPTSLKNLLDTNKRLIEKYYFREDGIREMCKKDWMLRYNPPQNEYKYDLEKLYEEVSTIINDREFIGFHCTRLLDFEVDNIKQNGLQPLTLEFTEFKLEAVYSNGFISKKVMELLLNDNESNQEIKMNRVCTIFCHKGLLDEGGFERLFGSWGGESIYRGKERDDFYRNEVLNLGKPRIVLAILKNTDIPSGYSLSECIVKYFYYENNKDKYDYEFEYDIELHTNRVINIASVISSGERLFEELTNYSTWEYSYK